MEPVRAIRLIALKNVLDEPDASAHWRHISRYYSKTFSTPLHLVDELPRLDVLQAYFEDVYEHLEDVELQRELAETLKETDALKREIAKTQDAKIDDILMAEAIAANAAAAKPKATTSDMVAALDKLGQAITDIKATVEPVGLDFSGLDDSTDVG